MGGTPLFSSNATSIRENTFGVPYQVIMADDGSTDQTIIAENFIKNIHIIKNEKNLGFLGNCNAANANSKYFFFLNSDTEVKPGWLNALLDPMKDDKIGMTGSKLIYPDGKLQEAGGIIWNDASGWNYGHKQNHICF